MVFVDHVDEAVILQQFLASVFAAGLNANKRSDLGVMVAWKGCLQGIMGGR